MVEPIGRTTRWFGESWGAPICEPAAQIPIPLGKKCSGCEIEFKEGDQGISIPRLLSSKTLDVDERHLKCFLASIGVDIITPDERKYKLHQVTKWLMTCSDCGETYDKSDDSRHDCLTDE